MYNEDETIYTDEKGLVFEFVEDKPWRHSCELCDVTDCTVCKCSCRERKDGKDGYFIKQQNAKP